MDILKKKKEEKEDSYLLAKYLETCSLDILAELYGRYIYLVYGTCMKYLSNREDSKDAVNMIFESLITEIPKHEIKKFRPWLYVVVKNHCLMRLRKTLGEKKKFEKYATDFMHTTEISHPIDDASHKEMEQGLKKCLEHLKKEQQECVKMFYYQELCYKEIAEELEINEAKVKSHIQNGRRNLKICIEKREWDGPKKTSRIG